MSCTITVCLLVVGEDSQSLKFDPIQIDLHEANQRIATGGGGGSLGPNGQQEVAGLKKTIDHQKKDLDEMKAQLELKEKAMFELEAKIKQVENSHQISLLQHIGKPCHPSKVDLLGSLSVCLSPMHEGFSQEGP